MTMEVSRSPLRISDEIDLASHRTSIAKLRKFSSPCTKENLPSQNAKPLKTSKDRTNEMARKNGNQPAIKAEGKKKAVQAFSRKTLETLCGEFRKKGSLFTLLDQINRKTLVEDLFELETCYFLNLLDHDYITIKKTCLLPDLKLSRPPSIIASLTKKIQSVVNNVHESQWKSEVMAKIHTRSCSGETHKDVSPLITISVC